MPELEAFTAMRLSKDLLKAARRVAKRKNISLSEFMRPALERAVKKAAMRRRKPETLEGGVDPP
jgi:hypothetical protein